MIASTDTGRATSGVLDADMRPYDRATPAPVIACHGMNGQGPEIFTFASLYRTLADNGCLIVAPSTTNGWGNATSRSRVADAVTRAGALGAAAVPPVIVGISHGASVAVQVAAATEVAALVLIVPGLDLEWLRTQSTVEGLAGIRASIDAAWGVTYPAALPAGASPMDQAAAISSTPVLMFTASDDDISTNHATFASTHGNTTSVDLGPLGHSLAAVDAVDTTQVVAFIHQHSEDA